MTFTGLNEIEHQLCQAFPRGAWVDLRTGDAAADDLASAACWGPDRIVRAEVIRALLLGAGEVEAGYAPGVRLRGARIAGRLDLMGATVPYPLVCEYCYFDDELRFVESATRTVRFISSFLPTLNGTRMRFSYLLVAAGWVLVTTVAAGAARVLSRRRPLRANATRQR